MMTTQPEEPVRDSVRKYAALRPSLVAPTQQALELVRSGRVFDVAVLDMHMPGLDGEQLAMALRALPAGQDLPLVLLSSLAQTSTPDMEPLFAAVLTKPARSVVLRRRLLEVLVPVQGSGPAKSHSARYSARIASSSSSSSWANLCC